MTEQPNGFERRFAQRLEAYLDEGVGTMDPKDVARSAIGSQRPATGRLRMATLAAGTLVAAAVITVFAVQLVPSATPGASTSPRPSSSADSSPSLRSSPIPTVWPTVAQATTAVPARLDLARLGFWTLERPLDATHSKLRLRVGTLDGRVAASIDLDDPGIGPLQVPLLPTPVGPADGRVLYVVDDGHEAALHVVSALTGVDQVLVRTTGFIPSLAIDPSGSTAYYVTLARDTGTERGVDAISTDGGVPRVIVPAQDKAAPFPQLAVSGDGEWLVFASCRSIKCDVYATRPHGDAAVFAVQIQSSDTIVGTAGDLLIGASTCPEAQCDGFALDLQTGDRWPLGGDQSLFDPKQLIHGPRGPLALGEGEDYANGKWHVDALDLTDRTQALVFNATFKPTWTVVRLADKLAGAELPPGWFLIYRNADAAPNPYPDYSAATLGGTAEQPLEIMTFPQN